jgi:hypothetical protein
MLVVMGFFVVLRYVVEWWGVVCFVGLQSVLLTRI